MAILPTHQPLLETTKSSVSKTIWVTLSMVAIIISSALIASYLIKPTSFSTISRPHHVCKHSLDKARCIAHVDEVAKGSILNSKDLEINLLHSSLTASTLHIEKAMNKATTAKRQIQSPKERRALLDCEQLLDLSVDKVRDSKAALNNNSTKSQHDAHTWLSGVLTYHVNCLDGLDGSARTLMEAELNNVISRAKTTLDMFVATFPPKDVLIGDHQPLNGDLPSWVTREDQGLLESSSEEIKANVVVAKDGSGNFTTVTEAVASVPDKATTRYVIYVKNGTYEENVQIGKSKTNVMVVGDGMAATILTGSLNNAGGASINDATLVALGNGFIAQDIGIQNTAGPQKHQAVALRVVGDQSVINRCNISGYQDTLYAQAGRQFFRDSIIEGTIDFIFGEALVVLQKCKIIARKPLPGQSNMVTAQKRSYENQKLGTSIQLCDIIPSPDLKPLIGSVHSFLGRPWGDYSLTVVMQSFIDAHIDPAGWSVWASDKDPMLKTRTLYYGEYNNTGPGADVSKRVTWTGYHVITDTAEATKFTVAELIDGESWLKNTGVDFQGGL